MERWDKTPMPASPDPSDPPGCVQWPLAQPWPPQANELRLGVMASGEGSNFEALVAACREGPLRGRVLQLVVNNPRCGAQERARRLGIPCALVDHRRHRSREESLGPETEIDLLQADEAAQAGHALQGRAPSHHLGRIIWSVARSALFAAVLFTNSISIGQGKEQVEP